MCPRPAGLYAKNAVLKLTFGMSKGRTGVNENFAVPRVMNMLVGVKGILFDAIVLEHQVGRSKSGQRKLDGHFADVELGGLSVSGTISSRSQSGLHELSSPHVWAQSGALAHIAFHQAEAGFQPHFYGQSACVHLLLAPL